MGLVETGQLEAIGKQTIHIARYGAVLLDNPCGKPVGHTRTFPQIVIGWPDGRACWMRFVRSDCWAR
jgi:hypothetical protein